MSGIDHDTQRRKGKIVPCGNAGDDMRLHIDYRSAGRPIELTFFGGLGDRRIDTEDRRVNGAVDEAKKLARPHRIRGADGL